MKQKLFSMLALLLMAATGAMAQTTINVTAGDLGKAVCTDGSIYDDVYKAQSAGKTAAAKIICLDTQNSKALALSLDNQAVTPGTVDYATAQSRCEALNTTLAVTFGTWVLPSKAQWEAMIEAAGGYKKLRDGIGTLFGGTKMEAVTYWSSTAGTTGHWRFNFNDGDWDDDTDESSARACLVINLPQTYSVTLADGTEDADKWTISPTEATEGAEVTAKYNGDRKVKSVKAVKKAAAPSVPDGAINGKFSVSDTKQVYFSKGNLRYASGAWSFFDNQYDYYTSFSEDAWDHFGWSTSATTYGMNTSQSNSTYSGDFVDWGATMGTGWFTLSSDEWTYLFNTRTTGGTVFGTSSARYAHATINTDGTGVNGIILFPDGVDIASTEVTTAGSVNANSAYATKCTTAQWSALAAKGCVFLPAAGYRSGSSFTNAGSRGYYWSSSPYSTTDAYRVYFSSDSLEPADFESRILGHGVRLVREVTE